MIAARRRLWLVLGVESIVLALLAAWILSRLGKLLEPKSLLVAALIVVIGDVVTALLMQRLAPTAIVVEPGEQRGRIASAVGDFDHAGRGRVTLRGERWRARAITGGPILQGARLRVLAREGLVLVVEPLD